MKILLDSYALFEYYKGSDKGAEVRKLMKKNKVLVSSICLYELLNTITIRYSKKEALDQYRSLTTHYKVVSIDDKVALSAYNIKRKHDMPMGDCLIYASAKGCGAKVVSGCKHFRKLKKERDVIII